MGERRAATCWGGSAVLEVVGCARVVGVVFTTVFKCFTLFKVHQAKCTTLRGEW